MHCFVPIWIGNEEGNLMAVEIGDREVASLAPSSKFDRLLVVDAGGRPTVWDPARCAKLSATYPCQQRSPVCRWTARTHGRRERRVSPLGRSFGRHSIQSQLWRRRNRDRCSADGQRNRRRLRERRSDTLGYAHSENPE
jgi:hypothetical protein